MAILDERELLTRVKMDLSLLTNSRDEFIVMLIRAAKAEITAEGIKLVECDQDANLVAMYAAYLFRKRAEDGAAAGMPRMLRYALNNRIFGPVPKSGTNGGCPNAV